MKNKNLLIITSAFPNNLHEYEGIFVREQLLFLKKYFKNIYVIRPQYFINPKLDIFNILPISWKEKPLRKNYEIDNIKVFFPKVSIFQPFKNWQIKKYIKKNNIKFGLIHSHFVYPSGEIGNYLKKEFGVKHICTAHGFDIYDLPFKNKYWNFKIRNILKNIDKVITVSKTNINCLEKLGTPKNKITLIPNGYNNEKFYILDKDKTELKKELGLQIDKRILINVGNLVPVKNQEYLLDEFSKLGEDYNLIIIGDGYLKDKLQEKIKKLNLENKVFLLGKVDNIKLIYYFNASDIFVLPSISESTGLVALEAGACGLQVITYKNGGTEDYVNNEVGKVLEKGESFFGGILDLDKKDKKDISKYYFDNFSLKLVVEEIKNLYN